jgi:hemerythrin-like domain-containing protein
VQRSEALAPLSRDHQHALYAALRLRRAERATITDAVEHFLRFFEDEGRRHFEIEEELVLPALPGDDVDWSASVARVREDHEAIRAAAAELVSGGGDVDAARALGERLHDHVRFEERALFPMLEARLSHDDLRALGEAIARAEAE